MHFNPRAPCGARLLWFKYSTEFIYFNPRAPCGARRTEHGEAVIREKFQSTRPVWGATKAAAGDRPRQLISIHAPRVGRDSGRRLAALRTTTFQSTRPVWGATTRTTGRACRHGQFQSTRPVWGATRAGSLSLSLSTYFNPRAPCGARPISSTDRTYILHFNPRAPCGARPVHIQFRRIPCVFQSTRPVWGATTRSTAMRPCFSYFNPRAPCGARRSDCHRPQRLRMHFNPRAPCGARPTLF